MGTSTFTGRRKAQQRRAARLRRHRSVRKKIFGTSERPRLAVFRSARHIYVQLIDDVSARTIASASTLDPNARDGGGSKTDAAKRVGILIAERAKAKGVEAVAFDRGGYIYHGRVAALAAGAREGGLLF